jgi:hypothetical protein
MSGQPGPAFGRPECKLGPGINVLLRAREEDADGRVKSAHDGDRWSEFLHA